MSKRLLFSIMLLLAILPLLGTNAVTKAQSLTTVTSFVTLTTQFTSTSQGFYTAGTSFATSTERGNLYSNTLSIDATGGQYGCVYHYLPFTASKGQHLTGQMTSSIAIDFYIMSDDSFKKWVNMNRCDVKSDTIVRKQGIISYAIDLTIANDGQYQFLFVNSSDNIPADVTIDVGIGEALVTTVAQPIYSSATQTIVFALTQTSSSLRTEELPSLLSGSNSTLLLVAIIAVIVVGGFLAYRSFSGKKKSAGIAQRAGQKFCIGCAAPLPQGAKFCNKCGATQL